MNVKERNPVLTGVLIALSVIGIILFLWFLKQIGPIVGITLLAIVLATGIAPLIDRIMAIKLPPRGWRLSTGAAIILVYLVIILVIGVIGTIIGTVLVKETILFANNAPHYYDAAQKAFTSLQEKHKYLPDLAAITNKLREQFGTISSYAYQAAGSLVSFLGNILVIITVFILTYYMLASRHSVREGFLRLIPPQQRSLYDRTFSEMGAKMGGWLRGQLLLALIVGTVISIFLWVIGVPYALIIGLIGAVAEMAPMVGPAVAVIPAVLLVLFQAKWQLIVIIIFFTLLSQFDSNYLTPRIMKQHAGLNPLVTILSLLVGVSLGGILGALLAIPLTAAVQVFIQRIVLPAIERAQNPEK